MSDTELASASLGDTASRSEKRLGFWSCWSLTVGIMIGSGVFLLPSVLAPFGMMSFAGWALTSVGSICLALVIARLASRTSRSGGVYAYSQEAFGDFVGFIVAWGYWAAYWIAIPALAIAFVGYLGVFIPGLANNPLYEALSALVLIWLIALINIKGVAEAGAVQLLMTILKLLPLLLIIGLGVSVGEIDNLPAVNPSDGNILSVLAATALLTMWAFSGLEAGTMPAADVKDPERTIPRAIIVGTLTVAFIYIASTFAVMLLVPANVLLTSTAPFSDAAQAFGPWGAWVIAVGAMISTAGALNGTIFILGQLPMAVALDGLVPQAFAQRNRGGASSLSIIMASTLGSVLLMANYTKGLLGMFMFLSMMSTLAILVPLLISTLAELIHSWRSLKGWAGVAILALCYSAFAILGSGLEVAAWGLLLLAVGIPVYLFGRTKSARPE